VILRYNSELRQFEMLALTPIGLNSQTISVDHGFTLVKATDKIVFPCARCDLPHVYYIVLPNEEQQP
jgi:hypothetical protein